MVQPRERDKLVGGIVGRDMRRLSTAAVLFHHALAERMGLGPTDLKCYDLLRERGAMTGSALAALTGVTTGAVTGVVARLERAGFVHRAADPSDGRKQILSPVANRAHDAHPVFRRLPEELRLVLDHYSARDLATVTDFLSRTTALLHQHIGQLRAERMTPERTAQPTKRPAQRHSRTHTRRHR